MRAIYLNDRYASISDENLSMEGHWRTENEAALLYADLGDMIDKNEMERGDA
jgi:hypothetical protein